jgi:hypothetical protein
MLIKERLWSTVLWRPKVKLKEISKILGVSRYIGCNSAFQHLLEIRSLWYVVGNDGCKKPGVLSGTPWLLMTFVKNHLVNVRWVFHFPNTCFESMVFKPLSLQEMHIIHFYNIYITGQDLGTNMNGVISIWMRYNNIQLGSHDLPILITLKFCGKDKGPYRLASLARVASMWA